MCVCSMCVYVWCKVKYREKAWRRNGRQEWRQRLAGSGCVQAGVGGVARGGEQLLAGLCDAEGQQSVCLVSGLGGHHG